MRWILIALVLSGCGKHLKIDRAEIGSGCRVRCTACLELETACVDNAVLDKPNRVETK